MRFLIFERRCINFKPGCFLQAIGVDDGLPTGIVLKGKSLAQSLAEMKLIATEYEENVRKAKELGFDYYADEYYQPSH